MDLQLQIMTFNIIIDALLNAGQKDDQKNLFAAISDNGFRADVATYNVFMKKSDKRRVAGRDSKRF